MSHALEQLMIVPLADRRIPDVDAPRPDLRAALEQHHAACVGWALSCCRWITEDADDVLQSSYLKILDGRARYSGRSVFKTWVFGVIRRTAAERRRRQALSRLLSVKLLSQLSPTHVVGDSLATLGQSEDNRRLVGALEVLPRRQREVLHLVFYEDMRIEDAAAVLGISLGTARTHYERGKARLRQLLTAEEDT